MGTVNGNRLVRCGHVLATVSGLYILVHIRIQTAVQGFNIFHGSATKKNTPGKKSQDFNIYFSWLLKNIHGYLVIGWLQQFTLHFGEIDRKEPKITIITK